MAQEAALHGSQEPELYFLLFTSQSERACVLGILLNGKIVMAFPRCGTHSGTKTEAPLGLQNGWCHLFQERRTFSNSSESKVWIRGGKTARMCLIFLLPGQ